MGDLNPILLAVTLLLLACVIALAIAFRSARVRTKRRWLFSPWPVKKESIADLDTILHFTNPLFDKKQAALVMRPLQSASSPEILESWVLAAAARDADTIFEFGTCTGRTTLMLALNSPPNARIHTLTLHPDHFEHEYQADRSDVEDDKWKHTARKESKHTSFLYEGTAVTNKVTQIFGDSKKFDETPLAGTCNLIFIDGGHSYSYVKSDTEKALRMLAPGGLIFWHDYKHKCPGVFSYLNALSRSMNIRHIADTSLVVYHHA